MARKTSAEAVVKDIQRKTRKKYSAEEKIRIVLAGLHGENSTVEPCRRERTPSNLCYRWSKDFLEAGKKRLMGDRAREASSQDSTAPMLCPPGEHVTRLSNPFTVAPSHDVSTESRYRTARRDRPMARFLRRVGLVAVCLGALNACEFKFGADWYDDYSKPGVSSEGRTAAINQCRQRIGQTGGAVANKSAYVRSDRMDNCLQRRGFAKRGRRGPAGR